jgi:hypothetical protein
MLYSEIPNSAPTPPRWARLADFACLVITLLSIVIAVSGGFRVRVGAARIALTSPWRLLIWAIALGVIRHVLAPGAPIYRDLPRRIVAMWRSEPMRAALPAFVGTRAAILFVGYLAVFMVGYREGGAPWKIDPNEFVNLQARWDAGWYLTIAIDGYAYDRSLPADAQQDVVFFPAFPMAMRAAGRLLGGSPVAYLFGGTLISLGAFLWALAYLVRFARDTLGDADHAAMAMWLLAAYPFALFFSALYTESLYLLAIVGACFHFRRGEYAKAGAWGLVAGLDRAPGCFLAIALGLMAIEQWMPRWIYGGRASRSEHRVRLVPAIAAAAMPGIAVLLFSAYVGWLTGNPLAWEEGHAAWGRQYNGLGVLVAQRADWLWNGGLYAYTANAGGDLLNVLGAVFVIATAWPVARRLGLPYAVLILINILPPLAAGGFLSAGRFSSVLFPSFVWLGGAIPARHRSAWLGAFMAVQAFCAVLFYTWRPLY